MSEKSSNKPNNESSGKQSGGNESNNPPKGSSTERPRFPTGDLISKSEIGIDKDRDRLENKGDYFEK